jgi:8-oxo-dGTP pyrophosphatase MutT (NUDIX family)
MERGETLEQSALRELKEESGLDSVTIVGKSEEVHQYDFPVSYRKHRPDNVRGQRIQFVFAVANAEARVHVDEKEIDGHVWVLPEDLHRYILRTEYLRLVEKIAREAVGLL